MRPQHIGGAVVLVTTLYLQLQWYTSLGTSLSTVYDLGHEGIFCTPISKDFGETATRISCAIKCERQPWCVGVFHSNVTMSCYGVDATSTDSCSSDGVFSTFRFYRKTALKTSTAGLKPITTADPTCATDEDCTPAFPHTDCRQDGACTCVAGFSFVPATNTCVTSCPADHGDSFTLTSGHRIRDYDYFIQVGREFCLQKCRDMSWCNSVSYSHSACYANSGTKHDYERTWEADTAFDYYQRNCA